MDGAEGIVGVIITCIVILMVLILSYWSSLKEWYDHYAEKRQKTEVGQDADEIAELLAEIKVIRDEGRTLSGGLSAQKQERLRKALHISEDQWRKTCKVVSIDDIIDKLSFDLRLLRPLTYSRKEETSTNIPEKASGEISKHRLSKDESSQDETPQRTAEPTQMSKLEKHTNQFGPATDRRFKISHPDEMTELVPTEEKEDGGSRVETISAADPTFTSIAAKQNQHQCGSASENKSKQSDYMKMQSREEGFPISDGEKILNKLGLAPFYPSKISLQDIMTVQKKDTKVENHMSTIPWLILQKLIMVDFKARESELKKAADRKKDKAKDNEVFDFDDFMNDSDDEDENSFNPLDVFLVTYACCDISLKQIILQKLFSCRLAVPFVTPQLSTESLLYSLWALRNITVEWKNKDQDCTESSVVSQPANIISFLRVGSPSQSKSVLLNNVISDQSHPTFWNRTCSLGETEKHIANGLVEAQWYLPSDEQEDIFKDVTMFLNLRGDACEHRKQVELVRKMSNVAVCCIESKELADDQVLDTMRRIHQSSPKVILILTMKELHKATLKEQIDKYFQKVGTSYKAHTKVILGCKGKKQRSPENVKEEIRASLKILLQDQTGMSVQEASLKARGVGIEVDEEEKFCKIGKKLAGEIEILLKDKPISQCKTEMLPLQSKTSEKLSELNKSRHKVGGKDYETKEERKKIELEIKKLKEVQLKMCENLSPLVTTFIENLVKVIDTPAATLFLQWLKIYLDDLSRKTLPELHNQFHRKWKELKRFEKSQREASDKSAKESIIRPNQQKHKRQSSVPEPDTIAALREKLHSMEKILVQSSLGVEHLFREIAQIYETVHNSSTMLNINMIHKLPELAAKQLLKGQPLEIMDGDAANVPITWIKAVFSSLKDLVGDKKLLVASVLGVQSSGKSTLLNTMFGLQFAVSAGRCTRGIYAQLIEVQRGDDPDLPEYILVCDTEGLRAPELGQMKHNNDNELATFIIGLGDFTIMNIKGENLAEMSDVLQIVVHAFLRMKRSKNDFQTNRTCYFIHQNVAAKNAKTKMQQGTKRLQENLDEMTKEACHTEKILDIQTFNEVINFDTEKNVWFFPDLWYGNPPMAPVNPEYTKRVQGIRDLLLNEFAVSGQTFLTISDTIIHMTDLWEGVLAEDFVFSFKNSLEAKAYDGLETSYHKKSWDAELKITKWVNQTATVDLQKSETAEKLDTEYRQLCSTLRDEGNNLKTKVHTELNEYFQTHTLKDILVQWKIQKLRSLAIDMDSIIERAKQTLQQEKENRKIHLLQKVKFAEIDIEMMRRAKSYAEYMKGQQATAEELESLFEDFWKESVSQLVPKNTVDPTPIAKTVEHLLYKRLEALRPDVRQELLKNPLAHCPQIPSLEGSFTIKDVQATDISISSSVRQWFKDTWNNVWGKHPKDATLHCREQAKEVINDILKTVDTYLSNVSQQDSDFHEIHAAQVIYSIVDAIEQQNQEVHRQNSFMLRPNLMVKVVVHACRYAVGVFNRMREQYQETHDIAGQLNTKKKAYTGMFNNMVNKSTNTVIAADLLFAHLEVLVKRSVRKEITVNIVDEILCFFGKKKFSLLVKILGELVKGSFSQNKSFLQNPKAYSLEWLTSFTKGLIFSDDKGKGSMYTEFAETEIKRLSCCIEKGLMEMARGNQENNPQNMFQWVRTFCNTMEGLPVTENDLSHVTEHNVEDLKHFEKLLMDRLPHMKNSIMEGIYTESPDSIKWEGTSPYTQILDKLWGCEARCPFCEEVCQRTDVNHPGVNHQCIQHKPQGVGGVRKGDHGPLWLNTCSFDIQSKTNFRYNSLPQLKHLTEYSYPYRDYKKYLPNWEIAPSPTMESSKYWLWFMAKYKAELAEWYNAEVPDIPEHWKDITEEEARRSLFEHYG